MHPIGKKTSAVHDAHVEIGGDLYDTQYWATNTEMVRVGRKYMRTVALAHGTLKPVMTHLWH